MRAQQANTTAGTRRRFGRAVAAVCLSAVGLFGLAGTAMAQVSPTGQKQMGEPAEDKLPPVLSGVTIQQHLDQQLPLNAPFVDESGQPVTLAKYFNGKRPVILAMVYYKCPILCSEELKGLTGALEMVSFQPGREFDIVAISIDPSETPAIAASKKREYVTYYGHPESASGWHFLTGQQPSIEAVSKATGFNYVRTPGPDGRMTQFAHASAIQIVTPEGKIAQYYMGVEYSPQDIRLGLIEASDHKIGSPVDTVLTYCYHYDPTRNKHSVVVARVVQLGGVFTVLGLGGYMAMMFRRDLDGSKQV